MKLSTLAKVSKFVVGTLAALLLSQAALAALEWPQEIDVEGGKITVYQPQPEKLVGNVLSSRAAFSLELSKLEEPIFGAMWFTARIDTDMDTDIVLVRDLRVEQVVWPESEAAEEKRFSELVEAAVPASGFEISLERLSASLESAETVQRSLENLNTDPPIIMFREEVGVLLLYDGEPRFMDVENSPYERAMNVPFAVVREKSSKVCWLFSGKFWYRADNPLGPWEPSKNAPADLQKMMAEVEGAQEGPSDPPTIIVATAPTELIVTDGKPDWVSLAGGELLYVRNTESPWLRELASNNMYLLLSGRWYRAERASGPWEFVRPDQLPDSFSKIPPASDIGGIRVSVAGTEEADDAVRDAAIPQTAAIKRSEAKLEIEYDGEPVFEQIKDTRVAYAVNTSSQVMKIEDKYYAVDNGVWFTADSAKGPWVVADSVPEDEIAKIPPSAPVYNVTHVHVYESTPQVVYVGYTPGYLWSYPYYGVPVYGTGWYYPPYWGRVYYPRPVTYGFHVGYNPWTGWNFGMSWSNGFFTFGMSWGGGYHGGYRPHGWYGGGRPTLYNSGDININIGNNINIGDRNKIQDRMNNNPALRDRVQNHQDNVYNRPENRVRNADSKIAGRDLQRAKPATGRANDLFADPSGRVARRNGDSWQTREGGKWSSPSAGGSSRLPANKATAPSNRATTPSTRPSNTFSSPSSRQSINTRDLNRSYNARQSGARREMSRPSSRGGYSGRGGGRRN